MAGSIRLGRLFGIPVNIHFTFLLLLAIVGLIQLLGAGLSAAFAMVFLISAVFGCVLLHEFGHVLAARYFGIAARDVTLLPIGGLARLERLPRNPRQELWISLAGPAVNVALAGLFYIGSMTFGGWFAGRLVVINVGLALFNLLPAFPKVLRISSCQLRDRSDAGSFKQIGIRFADSPNPERIGTVHPREQVFVAAPVMRQISFRPLRV